MPNVCLSELHTSQTCSVQYDTKTDPSCAFVYSLRWIYSSTHFDCRHRTAMQTTISPASRSAIQDWDEWLNSQLNSPMRLHLAYYTIILLVLLSILVDEQICRFQFLKCQPWFKLDAPIRRRLWEQMPGQSPEVRNVTSDLGDGSKGSGWLLQEQTCFPSKDSASLWSLFTNPSFFFPLQAMVWCIWYISDSNTLWMNLKQSELWEKMCTE